MRVKIFNSKKAVLALLLTAVIVILFSAASCGGEKFGIYLEDTGDLVLSEKHIKAYNPAENSFELNEKGIKQWNSFQTYEGMPNLAETLTSRGFVMKIDGREICRGKFWSNAISARFEGIVILDTLMPFNDVNKVFKLEAGYPGFQAGPLNPAITAELTRFFESKGLLK